MLPKNLDYRTTPTQVYQIWKRCILIHFKNFFFYKIRYWGMHVNISFFSDFLREKQYSEC